MSNDFPTFSHASPAVREIVRTVTSDGGDYRTRFAVAADTRTAPNNARANAAFWLQLASGCEARRVGIYGAAPASVAELFAAATELADYYAAAVAELDAKEG